MFITELLSFALQTIHNQWFLTLPDPKQSFAGQTILVTGANVGLGLEAARHFVRLGAERVVLACRSTDKGEKAKADIEQTTGRTGVLDVWNLDLGSYDSVKAFAKRAESLPRIDVLLNNAGVEMRTFSIAEDNETTITVNVISTFLLSVLLLPKLESVARACNVKPRLCIVSSEMHLTTKIPERNFPGNLFDNLADETKSSMLQRYSVSKLLEVFAARALVDQFFSPADQSPVTVNFVTPGLCYSELARSHSSFLIRLMRLVFNARTSAVGSRNLVYAAAGGDETHGKYIANCRMEDVAPFVTSDEGIKLQQKVWSDLSEKLEQTSPGLFERI